LNETENERKLRKRTTRQNIRVILLDVRRNQKGARGSPCDDCGREMLWS
jgi:hypothetical protein